MHFYVLRCLMCVFVSSVSDRIIAEMPEVYTAPLGNDDK